MLRTASMIDGFFTETYGAPPNRRRFFSLVFFCLLASVSSAQESGGTQIFNQYEIFPPDRSCPAYKQFLAFEPHEDLSTCRRLERFVIEGAELHDEEYVEKYDQIASQNVTLALILDVLKNLPQKDLVQAYRQANMAEMRAAIAFASRYDVERAALYSNLASEIRILAAALFCSEKFECNEIKSLFDLSAHFGEQFSSIEGNSPQQIMFCLLRVDAFVIPIRDVLASPRYLSCLPHS